MYNDPTYNETGLNEMSIESIAAAHAANATRIAVIGTIEVIEAIKLKNGKFQIDAVFSNGERETIRKQSNKKPSVVQAYTFPANGNHRGEVEDIGRNFTFSKSVPSYYKDAHIKSFIVA